MTPLLRSAAVWNRAAMENSGSTPRSGDRALAALLLAHGLVMNGGVSHAAECLSPPELSAAIAGLRFFGLSAAAAALEAIVSVEDAESLDAAYFDSIPDDGTVTEAFERHFNAAPHDFAPLDSTL